VKGAGIEDTLRRLGACGPSIAWCVVRRIATLEEAWLCCERADWLLWLAVRVCADRRLVVLASCDCARKAWCYGREGEDWLPRALDGTLRTAECWAQGEDVMSSELADAWLITRRVARFWDTEIAFATRITTRAVELAARTARDTKGATEDYADVTEAAWFSVVFDAEAVGAVGAVTGIAANRELAALARARIPWFVVERALEGLFRNDVRERP